MEGEEKYSREYFERRIEELRAELTTGFQFDTLLRDVVDPFHVFTSTIHTFSNTIQSTLPQTQQSLRSAQQALKDYTDKHPCSDDDDSDGDDDDDDDDIKKALQQTVDDAQKAVDDMESTIENIKDSIANIGISMMNATTTTGGGKNSDCIYSSNISSRIGILPSLLRKYESILLECTVLIQSTPTKLAEWCNGEHRSYEDDHHHGHDDERHGSKTLFMSQSSERRKMMLETFLNDVALMRQFLHSGGPSMGLYGPAIEIYYQIIGLDEKTLDDDMDSVNDQNPIKDTNGGDDVCDDEQSIEHRLALAVALELAKPIVVYKSGETKDEDTKYVDPIQRFYHYVDAYRLRQLDPSFPELSVWELRYVVDSNACHNDLMWGRSYLQVYRPDQIYWKDDQWRYLEAVRTDIGYRHPDHEFHNYVDLLSAGGVCGARAWFGRFMCKCFGMPTWGVRQPGHAALSRYRPSTRSWQICMGAAWKFSTWDDNRYLGDDKTDKGVTRSGPDFLDEAIARKIGATNTVADSNPTTSTYPCPCSVDMYYRNVTLVECLAECLGETVSEDFDESKIWRSLSLALRRKLSKEENKISTKDYEKFRPIINRPWPYDENSCFDFRTTASICKDRVLSSKCGAAVKSDDGTIVIPAANFVVPANPSKNTLVMDSYPPDGTSGAQLHLEHDGSVEYALPTSIFPPGSTFEFYCRVATVHRVDINTPLQVDIISSAESSKKDTLSDDINGGGKSNDDASSCSSTHEDGFVLVGSVPSQLPGLSNTRQSSSSSSYELPLPYTKGMWEFTQKISITIGNEVVGEACDVTPCDNNDYYLKLSRNQPCWGLTIKDLYFQPTTN